MKLTVQYGAGLTMTKRAFPIFREHWEGPYRVLDRLSDVTYRIGKVGKKKEKVVHFEKLKKYKGDLPRCADSIGTL